MTKRPRSRLQRATENESTPDLNVTLAFEICYSKLPHGHKLPTGGSTDAAAPGSLS